MKKSAFKTSGITVEVSDDGFKVTTARGWVQVLFGWGASRARIFVSEAEWSRYPGADYVVQRWVRRDSDDFQRLGRLLWPLYEKATEAEWPEAQSQ